MITLLNPSSGHRSDRAFHFSNCRCIVSTAKNSGAGYKSISTMGCYFFDVVFFHTTIHFKSDIKFAVVDN